MPAQIEVVAGPPCAGKSTYIQEHKQPGDVVVDLDRLAEALGHQPYGSRASAPYRTALMLRSVAIQSLMTGNSGTRAWVVDTAPDQERLAAWARAGATLTLIDPGPGACHRRAREGRPEGTGGGIDTWYRLHAGRLRAAASQWIR